MRIDEERQEEEARRRKQYKEQLQREMEEKERKSLQLEAELCRRRGELFWYKFGNKTRLDNFLGLQIEDVTQLRIGVSGPTGSGILRWKILKLNAFTFLTATVCLIWTFCRFV